MIAKKGPPFPLFFLLVAAWPYLCPEVIELLVHYCLLKKLFNWRIIALQYCVGLCHTST